MQGLRYESEGISDSSLLASNTVWHTAACKNGKMMTHSSKQKWPSSCFLELGAHSGPGALFFLAKVNTANVLSVD